MVSYSFRECCKTDSDVLRRKARGPSVQRWLSSVHSAIPALLCKRRSGWVRLHRDAPAIPSVTTMSTVSADGEFDIAGLHMTTDCETFEAFDPTGVHPTWCPAIETLTVKTVAQPYSLPADVSEGLVPRIEMDALSATGAAAQAAASAAAALAAAAAFAPPPPQVITEPSIAAVKCGYYVLASTPHLQNLSCRAIQPMATSRRWTLTPPSFPSCSAAATPYSAWWRT